MPPATSAKKVDGEPAYRKVHRGETVVLPPSRVFLAEATADSSAIRAIDTGREASVGILLLEAGVKARRRAWRRRGERRW